MDAHLINFFKTKKNIKLTIGALVIANVVSTFVPPVGAHEPAFHPFESEQSMSSDITLAEMRNMIYSSEKLTDEEKAFLYNEALFTDILPYINQSEKMKFIYRSKFDSFDIKNINPIMFKTFLPYQGWYPGNPSHNLYVRNYNDLDEKTGDTLSHEYVHATQDVDGYPFFIEPTAEMISSEYFGGEIDAYGATIKSLKVLMEIIGTEPIKQYVFTGDFSLIEERVKPNLSEEEYSEFINCISMELLSSKTSERNKRLLKIYQSLYLNIYGSPMRNDDVINHILSDDETLVRPYFNERLGDSYYITVSKNSKGSTGNEYCYLDPISSREDIFTNAYRLN